MGLFNVLKRLPLECFRWAFRVPCLAVALVVRTVRLAGRVLQRMLGSLLFGIVSESERILIIGAPNSGKSALLYRIKLGEFIQTVGNHMNRTIILRLRRAAISRKILLSVISASHPLSYACIAR